MTSEDKHDLSKMPEKDTANSKGEKSKKDISDSPLETPSDDDSLPPSAKRCWNCGEELKGEDWCDACKAPINEKYKREVLSRTTPVRSGKCWRCGGTTSGDVCGICGTPITLQGIKVVSKTIIFSSQEGIAKPDTLLLFSPKDQGLVEVPVAFSELETTVSKHFKIIQYSLTNSGPVMFIDRPTELKAYDEFERDELLVRSNIRSIFRYGKSPFSEESLLILSFFYWIPKASIERFSLKNIRWKFLLLLLTITSVAFTGWLYAREVYQLFSIEKSMFLDSFIFTASLLGIVFVHELGHFTIERLKKTPLSLPYFLPIPPIPGFMSYLMLGTAGGFIRVVDPICYRDDLFDLYLFGSLFGLVASIPLFLIGLSSPYLEDIANLSSENLERVNGLQGFSSIMLFGWFLEWFANACGIAPPFDPLTQVRFMHPLAYAGYIGIILNGLNFLPGSIMDGGFMFRSLFGNKATRVVSLISSMILMFNYNTWALGILTLFMPLNLFQIPVTNNARPVHWSKYLIEAFALIIALATVPVPLFLFGQG